MDLYLPVCYFDRDRVAVIDALRTSIENGYTPFSDDLVLRFRGIEFCFHGIQTP